MDPLTQASLGAAAAAIFSSRERVRLAVCVGALAGAAPDLDVLIRSEVDPLLALEYHRHFTHALLLAPLIGCLVAVLFGSVFFFKKWPLKELILYGVAGALTHGLIDACTSYGTLLYWPFSSHRESWDIISVIDPIFTLPLVLLTLFAFAWKRPWLAACALVLSAAYLSFGMYQRQDATQFLKDLAASRGHDPKAVSVRPSFGNTLLWRMVYRHEGTYFVDAVRIFPGSHPRLYEGSSVSVFGERDASVLLPQNSIAAQDVERFRFFSQGYLYLAPVGNRIVGDLRYSMFPNSVTPLWGIELDPARSDAHLEMRYFREPSRENWQKLWRMIQGQPIDLEDD